MKIVKEFEVLKPYKGYALYKMTADNSISWSHKEVWEACIFDDVKTAKHFINLRNKFEKNFYDVISEAQRQAIETNKGLVNRAIIDTFKLIEFAEEGKEPKKGDKIYVPSALYLSRGADDFAGGIATVSKVEHNEKLGKDHVNYCFVSIEERPGTSYNWRDLGPKQKDLKMEYKKQKAHPDPDMDPDANSWW